MPRSFEQVVTSLLRHGLPPAAISESLGYNLGKVEKLAESLDLDVLSIESARTMLVRQSVQLVKDRIQKYGDTRLAMDVLKNFSQKKDDVPVEEDPDVTVRQQFEELFKEMRGEAEPSPSP